MRGWRSTGVRVRRFLRRFGLSLKPTSRPRHNSISSRSKLGWETPCSPRCWRTLMLSQLQAKLPHLQSLSNASRQLTGRGKHLWSLSLVGWAYSSKTLEAATIVSKVSFLCLDQETPTRNMRMWEGECSTPGKTTSLFDVSLAQERTSSIESKMTTLAVNKLQRNPWSPLNHL